MSSVKKVASKIILDTLLILTFSNNLFKSFNKQYDLINLDLSKFEKNIKKINQKNEKVTFNQISNMANIHQSLLIAKDSEDLVYFVEDDYIHNRDALNEMIFAYERIATQIKNDLILCPTDYPYLYSKAELTQVFLGHNYHWQKIDETLCTFLTSKLLIVVLRDYIFLSKHKLGLLS